ncbi:reverse transcriptase domain-containing protein [Tanacetum coccineum]
MHDDRRLARCTEIDRDKIDVIAKFPYPTNVKGVRSFLGHAGFYRRAMNRWKFKPIYYTSKTLNNAQEHYTTTEKELLAVVFSLDKFHPYLILSKTIVYTDHSALKYLFTAEHLSRLENPDLGAFMKEEITDEFPDEHLMILKAELNDDELWLCPDNVMRRCVARNEILKILAHCHSRPTRGHHSASITGRKVYESGFFWPSIFKDAKDYVMRCDALAVDYVSKWVEAQALSTNDARVVIKFLRRLFARFGVPKALTSDRETHFLTNRAIKRILERSVGYNPKNWFENLDDALWAFRTAYKTPTGCTPFRLVYGKACHLPVEIEHKSYWALKQCNMDLTAAAKNRFMKLNELIELRDGAYENTHIYKERTKKWHDSRLRGDKDFKVRDKILIFNSRFKMHPGKLKSKWYGPNVVKTVYPYGPMEITDKNGISFKANRQRLKKYYDGHIDTNDKEVIEFEENTT